MDALFFMAAGMAVDVTRAYMVKERLSAALDAASLAVGSEGNLTPALLQTELTKYFVANYPSTALGSNVTVTPLNTTSDPNGSLAATIVNYQAQATVDWVHKIIREERDIVIASRPLEATAFQVENIRIAYVFYESGLSINVMYTLDDSGKRAVGFKLAEGMEVPEELATAGFKFARQKSKLAGVIRGSFFVVKGEY